jgi:signal transduction histidine kinase
LAQQGDLLTIRVQDWGKGFDPARVEAEHFGLEGIRQRARLLGGTANVESTPEQGTCLTVELPRMLEE